MAHAQQSSESARPPRLSPSTEQIDHLEDLIFRVRQSEFSKDQAQELDSHLLAYGASLDIFCERAEQTETQPARPRAEIPELKDSVDVEQGRISHVQSDIYIATVALREQVQASKIVHNQLLQQLRRSNELCAQLRHDRRKAIEAISPQGLVCSNMAYLKYRVRLVELELEDLIAGEASNLSMTSAISKQGIKQFKKEWGVAELMLSALQNDLLGEAPGISAATRMKLPRNLARPLPVAQLHSHPSPLAPSDPPPPYSSPQNTRQSHARRSGDSIPCTPQALDQEGTAEYIWPKVRSTRKSLANVRTIRIPRRQSSRPKIASLGQLLEPAPLS